MYHNLRRRTLLQLHDGTERGVENLCSIQSCTIRKETSLDSLNHEFEVSRLVIGLWQKKRRGWRKKTGNFATGTVKFIMAAFGETPVSMYLLVRLARFS
jgi:hypothetical protein